MGLCNERRSVIAFVFYATLTRLGQGCRTRFPRYRHRVFVIDFSPFFCGEMAELQEAVIVPLGLCKEFLENSRLNQ